MIQSYIVLTQTYLNTAKISKLIAASFLTIGRIDRFWESKVITNHEELWQKGINSSLIQEINMTKKDDFRQIVSSLYQKYEVPRLLFLGDLSEYSIELQEGLLKFLEEPPHNLFVILFAQDRSQIIPTITSRCITVQLPKKLVFENLDTAKMESIKTALPPVQETLKQLTHNPATWTIPDLKDVERDQLDFWLWQLLSYAGEYYKHNPNPTLADLITKLTQSRQYNQANLQKKLVLGWIKA